MGEKAQELRQRYFQFFVDNNTRERATFFRDPLIQFLWAKFRQDYAAKITDYIEGIGNIPGGGHSKNLERYLADVKHIEYLS